MKYLVLNRFIINNEIMVTVRCNNGKAVCIMPEKDYNRIIEAERKFWKRSKRSNMKIA